MDSDRDQIYITPVGAPDPGAIDAFWSRCRAAAPDLPLAVPPSWCFGDTVELADELIELVVTGPKPATAGAVDLSINLDHDGSE